MKRESGIGGPESGGNTEYGRPETGRLENRGSSAGSLPARGLVPEPWTQRPKRGDRGSAPGLLSFRGFDRSEVPDRSFSFLGDRFSYETSLATGPADRGTADPAVFGSAALSATGGVAFATTRAPVSFSIKPDAKAAGGRARSFEDRSSWSGPQSPEIRWRIPDSAFRLLETPELRQRSRNPGVTVGGTSQRTVFSAALGRAARPPG